MCHLNREVITEGRLQFAGDRSSLSSLNQGQHLIKLSIYLQQEISSADLARRVDSLLFMQSLLVPAAGLNLFSQHLETDGKYSTCKSTFFCEAHEHFTTELEYNAMQVLFH